MLLRRLQRKVFKGRFHCIPSDACRGERISLTAQQRDRELKQKKFLSKWFPNVSNLACRLGLSSSLPVALPWDTRKELRLNPFKSSNVSTVYKCVFETKIHPCVRRLLRFNTWFLLILSPFILSCCVSLIFSYLNVIKTNI